MGIKDVMHGTLPPPACRAVSPEVKAFLDGLEKPLWTRSLRENGNLVSSNLIVV